MVKVLCKRLLSQTHSNICKVEEDRPKYENFYTQHKKPGELIMITCYFLRAVCLSRFLIRNLNKISSDQEWKANFVFTVHIFSVFTDRPNKEISEIIDISISLRFPNSGGYLCNKENNPDFRLLKYMRIVLSQLEYHITIKLI